ncbi:MAG: peroxiredoxin [Bryobacteraceae bacterium]
MFWVKPLPAGTPAPSFILPDEEGNVFVLNQQRDRNVVLVFYPADDTPVCTAQLCEIRDRWELLSSRNVTVVGINPGAAESHAKFRQKHGFPFRILVDHGQRVAKIYKASAPLIVRRTVYLIDQSGVIRFSRRGKPPMEEVLGALG